MNEKKNKNDLDISSSDLKYILDVNQKAIEIYVSIGKQYEDTLDQIAALKNIILNLENEIEIISDHNEKLIRDQDKELIERLKSIISTLEKIHELQRSSYDISEKLDKSFESDIKKKLEEIDKNLFRLVIVFSSGLIGGFITVIIAIIQFMGKK